MKAACEKIDVKTVSSNETEEQSNLEMPKLLEIVEGKIEESNKVNTVRAQKEKKMPITEKSEDLLENESNGLLHEDSKESVNKASVEETVAHDTEVATGQRNGKKPVSKFEGDDAVESVSQTNPSEESLDDVSNLKSEDLVENDIPEKSKDLVENDIPEKSKDLVENESNGLHEDSKESINKVSVEEKKAHDTVVATGRRNRKKHVSKSEGDAAVESVSQTNPNKESKSLDDISDVKNNAVKKTSERRQDKKEETIEVGSLDIQKEKKMPIPEKSEDLVKNESNGLHEDSKESINKVSVEETIAHDTVVATGRRNRKKPVSKSEGDAAVKSVSQTNPDEESESLDDVSDVQNSTGKKTSGRRQNKKVKTIEACSLDIQKEKKMSIPEKSEDLVENDIPEKSEDLVENESNGVHEHSKESINKASVEVTIAHDTEVATGRRNRKKPVSKSEDYAAVESVSQTNPNGEPELLDDVSNLINSAGKKTSGRRQNKKVETIEVGSLDIQKEKKMPIPEKSEDLVKNDIPEKSADLVENESNGLHEDSKESINKASVKETKAHDTVVATGRRNRKKPVSKSEGDAAVESVSQTNPNKESKSLDDISDVKNNAVKKTSGRRQNKKEETIGACPLDIQKEEKIPIAEKSDDLVENESNGLHEDSKDSINKASVEETIARDTVVATGRRNRKKPVSKSEGNAAVESVSQTNPNKESESLDDVSDVQNNTGKKTSGRRQNKKVETIEACPLDIQKVTKANIESEPVENEVANSKENEFVPTKGRRGRKYVSKAADKESDTVAEKDNVDKILNGTDKDVDTEKGRRLGRGKLKQKVNEKGKSDTVTDTWTEEENSYLKETKKRGQKKQTKDNVKSEPSSDKTVKTLDPIKEETEDKTSPPVTQEESKSKTETSNKRNLSKRKADTDVDKTEKNAKSSLPNKHSVKEDENEELDDNSTVSSKEMQNIIEENTMEVTKDKKTGESENGKAVPDADNETGEMKSSGRGRKRIAAGPSKKTSDDSKKIKIEGELESKGTALANSVIDPDAKSSSGGRKRIAAGPSEKTSDDSKKSKGEEETESKGTTLANVVVDPDAKNSSGSKWNLKISTWNVSGLRAWVVKDGLKYLQKEDPDIFVMQETKCSDDKLPAETNVEGYHRYWCASKLHQGHSGVALFSKKKPITVTYGFGKDDDPEGRVITAEYDSYYVINAYVPNSGRGLKNLTNRMKWDEGFRAYLKSLDSKKPIIVCGDMNVSHKEIDLAKPKTNTKNAGFTLEERAEMDKHLQAGFFDSFRKLYPDIPGVYTFWTYMGGARKKNVGWRLDYFLLSDRLESALCDVVTRTQVYGSDHCPVVLYMTI